MTSTSKWGISFITKSYNFGDSLYLLIVLLAPPLADAKPGITMIKAYSVFTVPSKVPVLLIGQPPSTDLPSATTVCSVENSM